MTRTMIGGQLAAGAILLGLIAAMESHTAWDMAVQRLWFDSVAHEWAVSSAMHRHLTWLFYKGPKALLIAFGVACLAVALAGRRLSPRLRRGGLLMACSLILVPLLLGGAKRFTDVYCPQQLEAFGGSYAYQGVLGCRNPANAGRSPGRCFPAGHASGGFALMALFFALPGRRRWFGLAGGLAAGWMMGFYQMLRGQHFLSHTLFTMIGAWMIIVLIAVALNGMGKGGEARRRGRDPAASREAGERRAEATRPASGAAPPPAA